jgi:tetratricopeptide (TPR) repeat protein
MLLSKVNNHFRQSLKSHAYLVCVIFAALLLGCVAFRPYPDIRGSKAFEKGDFQTALVRYQEALRLYMEEDNQKGVATNLVSIGAAYDRLDKYSQALYYYGRGLDLANRINCEIPVPYAIVGVASIYSTAGDFKTADSYLQKLDLEAVPEDLRKGFLVVKGEVQVGQNRNQEGLDYYFKCLELINNPENPFESSTKAAALEGIAEAFMKKGNLSEAYDYANHAYIQSKSLGFLKHKSFHFWKAPYILGKSLANDDKYKEAEVFYGESVKAIQEFAATLSPELQKHFREYTRPVFAALQDLQKKVSLGLTTKARIEDKESPVPVTTHVAPHREAEDVEGGTAAVGLGSGDEYRRVEPIDIMITAPWADVRDGIESQQIIASLKKGDIVKKIGEKDNWVYVELPDGKVGWIHNALAEPILRLPKGP